MHPDNAHYISYNLCWRNGHCHRHVSPYPATTNENKAYGMFCNLSLMFNQYLIDPYCAILHYSASHKQDSSWANSLCTKVLMKRNFLAKINRFQLKLIIKEDNHYLPDRRWKLLVEKRAHFTFWWRGLKELKDGSELSMIVCSEKNSIKEKVSGSE